MKDALDGSELQIPEYEYLSSKLDCKNCDLDNCVHSDISRRKGYCAFLSSKYDCAKILNRISFIKSLFEGLASCAFTVFVIINFSNFWAMALHQIFFTVVLLLSCDFLSDILIKYIFNNSEKRRREKYDIKVKKIKEENEALRKAKAGITEDVQKFLDSSNVLYENLSSISKSITDNLNSSGKNGQRVIVKFQEVLKELEILNSKLSKDNFESSYITTLYELHLPKLLEYSALFSEHLSSDTLTSKQIVEFSNLLEVFKVKISKHSEYLMQKTEDDFLIKMRALNEDVLPDFDGSEETK